jgi:predicted metal-dependent HD superfamily phosphohydrolase
MSAVSLFRNNEKYMVKDSTMVVWETNWKVIEEYVIFTVSRNDALDIMNEYFAKLWDLYTDNATRHYHTAVHIEEMLNFYSEVLTDQSISSDHLQNGLITTSIVIILAIFFHDAIYDGRSMTNEEDSVKLFYEFANKIGINTDIQNEVACYIIATKKHEVLQENNRISLFLDLDLAVLGKEESAYIKYASLIRKEYNFVAEEVYCAKRAEILESFLKRQYIYGTTLMRNSFEMQARNNIQREISLLKRNVIPS